MRTCPDVNPHGSAGYAIYSRGESLDDLLGRAERAHTDLDLAGGIHYKESTRHFVEIEHWSYRKGLMALARRLERGLGDAARPRATMVAR